jgi:uncharacterized membrane protein YcaP (DUF421 family)
VPQPLTSAIGQSGILYTFPATVTPASIALLSRRPGAQMTPFEFVLVFLIGGVIILSTVGDDHSMTNCFGAVITICMMHHDIDKLTG